MRFVLYSRRKSPFVSGLIWRIDTTQIGKVSRCSLLIAFKKCWRPAVLTGFGGFPRCLGWVSTFTQTMTASVRFLVLTVTSMKMRAFRDIEPCTLVEVERRFKGAYCLYHQDDEWCCDEAERISETSSVSMSLHTALSQKAVNFITASHHSFIIHRSLIRNSMLQNTWCWRNVIK
jgi:hypothetical protein